MLLVTPATKRRFHLSATLNLLAKYAPTEDGRGATWFDLEQACVEKGYMNGLADLLEWVGLIQRHEDTLVIRVVSPRAGYALRLLADLLSQQTPLFEWRLAKSPELPGRSLLAALEQLRLCLLPHQDIKPVRQIEAVVGIITQELELQPRMYLLDFDEEAGEWQLPGGHYEFSDRTRRHTLLRELGEELHLGILHEPHDVRLVSLGKPFSINRLSPSLGVLTHTMVYPFLVTIRPGLVRRQADLYWATANEILSGRTLHGQRINREMICPILPRVSFLASNEDRLPFLYCE